MTCAHVLGLIDAGPFADYSPVHREAAWQHARQCATCGRALALANGLTADLFALPDIEPPVDLASRVLERISEVHQTRAAGGAPVVPGRAARLRRWSSWVSVGASMVAMLMVLAISSGDWAPVQIANARPGLIAGFAEPSLAPARALLLAVGLMLYAAGLFAPIGGKWDA